ncbi:hypothetical protein [Paracoccus benzoatiresistens]|uniref:Uncharacterized protein n=1 Tax=Paracoccus benzoatiresistens TaxID=2997341 RepID=A0ABT4J9G4_9RHOB|nr:hypothetical protein [Paracoccus sp. EF6]MCZ0963086.1 hypothetical protein [Paracoccus sp. EF6]
MTHKLPDETTTETKIRKRISHTCDELGLTATAANDMADRAIINLRSARRPVPGAPATQEQITVVDQPSHKPRETDEDLITKLLML